MKNKSVKTNESQTRDSATRSAGKQATGNRNKHLLAAERRRTDEADGRLNKQNPVSPQNNELHESKDGTKQNAGKYELELKRLSKIDDHLFVISMMLIGKSQLSIEREIQAVKTIVNGIKGRIAKLQ